jgi:hypothetical protein
MLLPQGLQHRLTTVRQVTTPMNAEAAGGLGVHCVLGVTCLHEFFDSAGG